MWKRGLLAPIYGIATVLLLSAAVRPAKAIEVQCIEASKYKYLFLIFGNDRRKLADFLQVSSARLPDPEMCRAVIIVGEIRASQDSKRAKQAIDSDKLLDMIARNRGWLATVYLASGGGNISRGYVLAELTRLFWLKSQAMTTKTFTYQPDFLAPSPVLADGRSPPPGPLQVPPELEQGWRRYVAAVAAQAQVTVTEGSGRCASACTFIHVAGIDRRGTVFVHRGRPSGGNPKKGAASDGDSSLAETLEQMQRSEAMLSAFYRSMDAGDRFIQLYQSTPTASVTPAVTDRIPRYLSDALRARCGTDLAQLADREGKIRAALDAAKTADKTKADKLQKDLSEWQARRGKFEQCVAGAQEKERLAQFAKFCSNSCGRTQILAAINAKLRELTPAKRTEPQAKGKRNPSGRS